MPPDGQCGLVRLLLSGRQIIQGPANWCAGYRLRTDRFAGPVLLDLWVILRGGIGLNPL